MKLEHSLMPYTKINQKWIKELSLRPDTIKLSEENIGSTLFDINYINIISNLSQNNGYEHKINKWNQIELKSFFIAKEIIKI